MKLAATSLFAAKLFELVELSAPLVDLFDGPKFLGCLPRKYFLAEHLNEYTFELSDAW